MGAPSSGDGERYRGRMMAVKWWDLAPRAKRGPGCKRGRRGSTPCTFAGHPNPTTKAMSWRDRTPARAFRGQRYAASIERDASASRRVAVTYWFL
jgi:hypothetical protein